MEGTAQRLRQEVDELLRQAAAADQAEDAQYGKGKSGDELPAELARRESRLKKIREAKAELEQEAKENAEKERAEAEAKIAQRREKEAKTGKKSNGGVGVTQEKLGGTCGRNIFKLRGWRGADQRAWTIHSCGRCIWRAGGCCWNAGRLGGKHSEA